MTIINKTVLLSSPKFLQIIKVPFMFAIRMKTYLISAFIIENSLDRKVGINVYNLYINKLYQSFHLPIANIIIKY